MKKNNIKYNQITKAKDYVVVFDVENGLSVFNYKNLINSCKGKTLRKYVKHILRCGSFYNDQFFIPSTRKCLDAKMKNTPLTMEWEYCDY